MEPELDGISDRPENKTRPRRSDRGAAGIEYALLLAVVVLVIVVGMRTLGTSGRDRFNDTACELQGDAAPADC
jgi:Flp pilus assembly pilin Flp